MRKFLSRSSVAELFDTSPATVDRWVAKGVIPPPFQMGGSKRWDIDDLLRAAHDAMGGEPDAGGRGVTDPDEATRLAIKGLSRDSGKGSKRRG